MRYLQLIVLLFVANNVAFSKINFNIDYAIFANDTNNKYLEIYYSFPDTLPDYQEYNDKYIGEVDIKVEIINSKSDTIIDKWTAQNVSMLKNPQYKIDLFGVRKYLVNDGKYKINIYVQDKYNSSKKTKKKLKINAKRMKESEVYISDIQFAKIIEKDSIKVEKWSEVFHKYGMAIVCNPRAEYSDMDEEMKLFVEFYNLLSVSPESYSLDIRILNSLNKSVYRAARDYTPDTDHIIFPMNLPLFELSSGVYYVNISITYKSDGDFKKVSKKKKFYYINEMKPAELDTRFTESHDFELSEFSIMSEERVEYEWTIAKIMALNVERDKWDMLSTLEAKQRFLYRFWGRRDPDYETSINERYVEFKKDLDYVNKKFKRGKMKGSATELGRVRLKYGEASEIDDEMARDGKRAYQIWYYHDLKGGSIFYFVDLYNNGNFRLVHCTLTEEAYNPNWYNDYVITE